MSVSKVRWEWDPNKAALNLRRHRVPLELAAIALETDTLNVPVAPTFVCFLDGVLTPVFLIPWTKLAFSNFQKILMSSLIQDALLTHQDFLGCDALVMAFPLIEETRQRYPVSWGVMSYALMDRERLNHQFLVYGRALRNVLAALDEEPDTA